MALPTAFWRVSAPFCSLICGQVAILMTSPSNNSPRGSTTDAFLIWRSRIARGAHGRDRALLAHDINQAPEPGQRSRAAEQRAASKKLTRATRGKLSMMNMGAPARHVPLPRFPSERERVLFAAHERRKAAGWIRG